MKQEEIQQQKSSDLNDTQILKNLNMLEDEHDDFPESLARRMKGENLLKYTPPILFNRKLKERLEKEAKQKEQTES